MLFIVYMSGTICLRTSVSECKGNDFSANEEQFNDAKCWLNKVLTLIDRIIA